MVAAHNHKCTLDYMALRTIHYIGVPHPFLPPPYVKEVKGSLHKMTQHVMFAKCILEENEELINISSFVVLVDASQECDVMEKTPCVVLARTMM